MLSKYEEAQGLTEEMVRDYMLRTGWTDCGGLWQKARDSVAALSSEMPEARQFGAIAQRYASANLPETIEAVRCAHMDHIITLSSSAEMTPADERCEVLLEALRVRAVDGV